MAICKADGVMLRPPYKIPSHWKWVRLMDLNERQSVSINPNKYKNTKFEHYSVPSFDNKHPAIQFGKEIKSTKQRLFVDEVLICKINPRINRVWVVDNNTKYKKIGSSEWIVVRPKSNIRSRFLALACSSPYFRDLITSNVSGVGGSLTRSRPKEVQYFPIPLPPLEEQKRIVAKLDSLLEKIKKARNLLEDARNTFKDRKAAILAKAFHGDLTTKWREENPDVTITNKLLNTIDVEREKEKKDRVRYKLPKTWKWFQLGEICEVKGGKRLPHGENLVEYNTGFPYIRARDLKKGTVIPDEIMYLDKFTQEKIKNYTVSSNDAYITIVGAKIGDAGLIPEEFNGANLTENAAKLTNFKGTNNYFVSIWLQSKTGQDIIQENILSATQGKLALSRIRENIVIPLPPLEEQKEIIKQLESLLVKEDDAKELLDLEEHLDLLEKSILAKAFRGEL